MGEWVSGGMCWGTRACCRYGIVVRKWRKLSFDIFLSSCAARWATLVRLAQRAAYEERLLDAIETRLLDALL